MRTSLARPIRGFTGDLARLERLAQRLTARGRAQEFCSASGGGVSAAAMGGLSPGWVIIVFLVCNGVVYCTFRIAVCACVHGFPPAERKLPLHSTN